MLADFIDEIPRSKTHPENSNWWTLNVNRASRQTGAGIGLQLKSPTRERIEQEIRLGFNTSNNESEYESLLSGIELAAVVSTDKPLIQSDSQISRWANQRIIQIPRPSNGKICLSGKTTLE